MATGLENNAGDRFLMSQELQDHAEQLALLTQAERDGDDMALIYDQFMNLGAQREVMRQMRENLEKQQANFNKIRACPDDRQ